MRIREKEKVVHGVVVASCLLWSLLMHTSGCGDGGSGVVRVSSDNSIGGTVLNSEGVPVEGLTVILGATGEVRETNPQGEFIFRRPAGSINLLIEANGSGSQVIVDSGVSAASDIQLGIRLNRAQDFVLEAVAEFPWPYDSPPNVDREILKRPCSANSPRVCGQAEYCDFIDSSCGEQGGFGVCRPIAEVCLEIFAPVCGCDGETYGNYCFAQGAGVSIAHTGECR